MFNLGLACSYWLKTVIEIEKTELRLLPLYLESLITIY